MTATAFCATDGDGTESQGGNSDATGSVRNGSGFTRKSWHRIEKRIGLSRNLRRKRQEGAHYLGFLGDVSLSRSDGGRGKDVTSGGPVYQLLPPAQHAGWGIDGVADLNEVFEEFWVYERVSEVRSISVQSLKSSFSLEVTSGGAFSMVLKKSAIDPESRLTVSSVLYEL
ncbi:uncharacterized protein G2W53_040997 [Senna tora]|uniref:Uncharacterized protein n=1 Tax=Senna tora TaxID=362788 RepID=A0A834SEF4_9FABA|nr:uncharacterized protein G2W53_040997 [Senna tora]